MADDDFKSQLVWGYASFICLTGLLIALTGTPSIHNTPTLRVATDWLPNDAWGWWLAAAGLLTFFYRPWLRMTGSALILLWCCVRAASVFVAWQNPPPEAQIYPVGFYGTIAWVALVILMSSWKRRNVRRA